MSTDRLFFPAIVVDFDGTIRYPNEDERFINGPEDVACYEGVFGKLWEYRDHGYVVLGLTNQAGVAFGHKTAEDVYSEVARMAEIAEDRGYRWPFHEWHAAVCHPDADVQKYRVRSLSRKPRPGGLSILAYRTAQKHHLHIDWDRSVLVGDSTSDLGCARSAGIDFLPAETFREVPVSEHDGKHIEPDEIDPDHDLRSH